MSVVVSTWLCDQDNFPLIKAILESAGDKKKLFSLCHPSDTEPLEDKGWIHLDKEEEIAFIGVGTVRMSVVYQDPYANLICMTNSQRENLGYLLSRLGD